jgi:hypothetical protein
MGTLPEKGVSPMDVLRRSLKENTPDTAIEGEIKGE